MTLNPNLKVRVIGVPLDLGASRRGVDMGPSAIRVAQLGSQLRAMGYDVDDIGNISVPIAEMAESGDPTCKFKSEILSTVEKLSSTVYKSLEARRTPLVLGGDHSIAMGTIAGISKFYRDQKKNVGLIWFDAHGDINTPETSPSGNIHGMPMAHVLGLGMKEFAELPGFSPMIAPENAVMIGVRELDQGEKDHIRKTGLRVFTMKDVDRMGLPKIMEEAIKIATTGTAGFHVSYDVDWLDPAEAPGVGTRVHGGGTYREGHFALECIADSNQMLSMEVTEVNPLLDNQNQTGICAARMILSAFGKQIL